MLKPLFEQGQFFGNHIFYLLDRWESVVGKKLATHSIPKGIKKLSKGELALEVIVNHPVIHQEFKYLEEIVLKKLNRELPRIVRNSGKLSSIVCRFNEGLFRSLAYDVSQMNQDRKQEKEEIYRFHQYDPEVIRLTREAKRFLELEDGKKSATLNSQEHSNDGIALNEIDEDIDQEIKQSLINLYLQNHVD